MSEWTLVSHVVRRSRGGGGDKSQVHFESSRIYANEAQWYWNILNEKKKMGKKKQVRRTQF